jgi:phage baseplate assembly protein gpV
MPQPYGEVMDLDGEVTVDGEVVDLDGEVTVTVDGEVTVTVDGEVTGGGGRGRR